MKARILHKNIIQQLIAAKQSNRKLFVVLIDPDKAEAGDLQDIITKAEAAAVDLFFVGGSLMVSDSMDRCLETIRSKSHIPSVLFPGNPIQLSEKADALLYLSLISGRNAELLIGNHVVTAPLLMRSCVEVMPTGYMLIDGGAPTTVSYISNTFPIPANKPEIAMATAMAGQLLGLKLIYMDAGSGAQNPVPAKMIAKVREAIELPIIVGGGIRTPEQAAKAAAAGADMIVVGNQLEENAELVFEMARAVHSLNYA
ncbi:MAG TPA: geranylgeranylglyceryl/heptaprenylglyceryl phosphate synthase [Saprospiraceae bacterium]|nr:geranylgeranylglyceryl/heptaprenylglyceryl phosphate synthase [Saprospiraceae bacterium]